MFHLLYKKFCLWRSWCNECEANQWLTLYQDLEEYRRYIKKAEEWKLKGGSNG